MRVKMRTTYAGVHGTAQPGHVIGLPDDHAEALIAGGYAEAHDDPSPPEETGPERAVIAPQEEAVAPVQRKNAAAKRGR